MAKNLLWSTVFFASLGLAQTIVGNPTGSQTITQPANTMLSTNKLNNVRYADQFAGADIGDKINKAILDCPNSGSSGCEIQIPAGNYNFGTAISITTPVKLAGAGPGISGAGTGTTVLTFTGSGVPISVTGQGARGSILRDFTLNNTGTGTVGIDIFSTGDIRVQNVVVWPSTPFSLADIRIGNGTLAISWVHLQDVYVRNNGTNLIVSNSQGVQITQSNFIQQTGSQNVILGDNVNGYNAVATKITNTSIEASANSDALVILRGIDTDITNCYFENDGTGNAINMSSTQAQGTTVTSSYFTGTAWGHATPTAITVNSALATLTVIGGYVNNYQNPANFITNTLSEGIAMYGVKLDSSGISATNSYTNFTEIGTNLNGTVQNAQYAGNVTTRAATGLRSTPFGFASLGGCGSGNEGTLVAVNDSSTNTWGATITGGGAQHVLAYCDGTGWTVAAK